MSMGPYDRKKDRMRTMAMVLIIVGLAIVAVAIAMSYREDVSSGKYRAGVYYDYTLERKSSLSPFFEPDQGNEYIVATILMENGEDASGDARVDEIFWDYRVNTSVYSMSVATASSEVLHTSVDRIAPGGFTKFQVVYEVPQGLGFGTIEYSSWDKSNYFRDDSLL